MCALGCRFSSAENEKREKRRETRKKKGKERESEGRVRHRVQRDRAIAHEIERAIEAEKVKIAHETYKKKRLPFVKSERRKLNEEEAEMQEMTR